MRQRLLLPLLMMAAAPAHGEQNTPPPASAYRQVMQAQYAADAAPLAMRPEEARRIYDSYLRSIGQPAKEQSSEPSQNNSTTSGGNAGIQAR